MRDRGLWLDGRGGSTGGAADGLAEALVGPSLIDLDSLSYSHPQSFYLADSSMEQLADCFAVLGGMRLPLHGQVLAAQAAVLRQLFLAQAEGTQDGSVSSNGGSKVRLPAFGV